MQTCKEKPPEPPDTPLYKRNIFLSVEDTGVTEITLKVTIPESVKNREFIVKRDGQTLFTTVLTYADTLLLDTALSPHHNYTYKAYRIKNNKLIDSSTIAFTTTMDTTSHEFTFVIDTLGDGFGSALYDVAIINENNIWAVGEMHFSGNDTLYDVAQWNGLQWNLLKASGFPAYAVYAFSSNDVWIGTTAPHHWNGQAWSGYNVTGIFNGYIKKMWGTSSSNLYIVGTNGSIAHFNGTTWTKMESGTNVDLLDIWGGSDGSIVWACGWKDQSLTHRVLLKYTGQSWEKIHVKTDAFVWDDTLSGNPKAVWTNDNKRLFVLTSYGVYDCPSNTQGNGLRMYWDVGIGNFYGYPRVMRGQAKNDIVISGYEGILWHYNGSSWLRYENFRGADNELNSIAYKKGMFVSVGYIYHPIHSKGLVIRGRKYEQ